MDNEYRSSIKDTLSSSAHLLENTHICSQMHTDTVNTLPQRGRPADI